MRLLLVSAAHHPTHGGIGTAVAHFIQSATSAGWHIEVITRPGDLLPRCARVHPVITKDWRPDFADQVAPLRQMHVIRPYRYGLWSLAVAGKLLEIDGDFDAIEFVDSQAEGYVSLTSRRVRERWSGTPMIIHAHTPMWMIEEHGAADLAQFGRNIYHQWERQALAAADGVRAPSELLLRKLNLAQRSAAIPHVIGNAAPRKRQPEELLLFIGNIEPNKGVTTWARSLNQVLRKVSSARALMIGRDTPTAPGGASMAAHVRSLLAPDLRQRLQWCNVMLHDEVAWWINRAAAVVVPSRFESFSYVAAEAVVRHVPVIITRNVGIHEYMPAVTAVDVDDDCALADAQCAILMDHGDAHRRAGECRMQLLTACRPNRILEQLKTFIHALQPGCNRADLMAIETFDEMVQYLQSIEQAMQERCAVHANGAPSA